jgi:hypothetical protein
MIKKYFFTFFIGIVVSGLFTPNAWSAESESRPVIAAQTATRYVKLYGALERNLQAAIQHNDKKSILNFLANNFEERMANSPNEPVPLETWINTWLQHPQLLPQSIEQIAAREIGSIVVVTSLWISSTSTPTFVIDIWSKEEDNSKLLARYTALASAPNAVIFQTTPILKKK